jgi:ribosomal subunit interface protein
MQISVKGKQLDVGESLRTHVETALKEAVSKYFSHPIEATVVLSRDAHLFCADITVHAGRGLTVQSSGSATDPYPAFDQAAERIAKRLRRHKTRLDDHHAEKEVAPAARYVVLNADQETVEDDNHHAMIIADMQTPVESLTVSQAVMRLDLGDLPALMFRNQAHGGLNMVYRRKDGNISWVDPQNGVAAAPVAPNQNIPPAREAKG